MIVDPVQRGVREYEIEPFATLRKRGDVTLLEAQAVERDLSGRGEHPRRPVQADRLAGLQLDVQTPRQPSGAAAEIGHAHPGRRPDEGDEIREGLFALAEKLRVLIRIPGVIFALQGSPPCPRYPPPCSESRI